MKKRRWDSRQVSTHVVSGAELDKFLEECRLGLWREVRPGEWVPVGTWCDCFDGVNNCAKGANHQPHAGEEA